MPKKPSVLAKPDLRFFVLGAFLILAIHGLASSSQEGLVDALPTETGLPLCSREELGRLVEKAAAEPDSKTFYRLSGHYMNSGQLKLALFMLQNAERISVTEDVIEDAP